MFGSQGDTVLGAAVTADTLFVGTRTLEVGLHIPLAMETHLLIIIIIIIIVLLFCLYEI